MFAAEDTFMNNVSKLGELFKMLVNPGRSDLLTDEFDLLTDVFKKGWKEYIILFADK